MANDFSEHGVTWLKCKMCPWTVQGRWSIRNDVVALLKQVAPEIVSIHCVIHREALVAKKLGNEEKITN